MKIHHKNISNLQKIALSNSAITKTSISPESIGTFVKNTKSAVVAIKIFYKDGFENIQISFKIKSTDNFFFIQNLPLATIANKIGSQKQDIYAWQSESLTECLIIEATKDIEITVIPSILIPTDSIIIVFETYQIVG